MLKHILSVLLLASLTACQSLYTTPISLTELQGNWHIDSIRGKAVTDYSPAQLTFAADGKLSGNNSCNNFFGSYQLDGKMLTLKPAGSTMKACIDELMAQEQNVMQLLPKVTAATYNDGKLLLLGSKSKVLLTLSRR
ncbi:META domain-containing protein [Shewanella yunxiaonensis]|uniref:META domain-containing protein n=1 Tax=Shewanella yunxiaonensis TaxID=2829809 RepID=A0ABX7YUR9_9GAMM|nr:META domain-containing protein [Shewanella yunxiaonensis]QUN06525.1 META domain-containing protein [Shewanella yunxiaonensis]